jgi:hypothetical protein
MSRRVTISILMATGIAGGLVILVPTARVTREATLRATLPATEVPAPYLTAESSPPAATAITDNSATPSDGDLTSRRATSLEAAAGLLRRHAPVRTPVDRPGAVWAWLDGAKGLGCDLAGASQLQGEDWLALAARFDAWEDPGPLATALFAAGYHARVHPSVEAQLADRVRLARTALELLATALAVCFGEEAGPSWHAVPALAKPRVIGSPQARAAMLSALATVDVDTVEHTASAVEGGDVSRLPPGAVAGILIHALSSTTGDATVRDALERAAMRDRGEVMAVWVMQSLDHWPDQGDALKVARRCVLGAASNSGEPNTEVAAQLTAAAAAAVARIGLAECQPQRFLDVLESLDRESARRVLDELPYSGIRPLPALGTFAGGAQTAAAADALRQFLTLRSQENLWAAAARALIDMEPFSSETAATMAAIDTTMRVLDPAHWQQTVARWKGIVAAATQEPK